MKLSFASSILTASTVPAFMFILAPRGINAKTFLSALGPDPSSDINMCQGDCDYSHECYGDLVCPSNEGAITSIPGCAGSIDEAWNNDRPSDFHLYDFCTEPSYLVSSSTAPYGVCEGNCSSDTDCESGLTCADSDFIGCNADGVRVLNAKYCIRHRFNVALEKPATQSSTFKYRGILYPAEYAVDGGRGGIYKTDTNPFAATVYSGKNPWWEVDLEEPYDIDMIKVFNREEVEQSQLAGFRVDILDENNETVWSYQSPNGVTPEHETTIYVQLGSGSGATKATGNKVKVSLPGNNKILFLAEVEVYVEFPLPALPSSLPSVTPSLSAIPSSLPSVTPSLSEIPSSFPSVTPSLSAIPSSLPSITPSLSAIPSSSPSSTPSLSEIPSSSPSITPSLSAIPSSSPSITPSLSAIPSSSPSITPSLSAIPSSSPSITPSLSGIPSSLPSITPSLSSIPSSSPSITPSLSEIASSSPSFTKASLGLWYIENTGEVTEEATSKDIVHITLPFNISNRDHGAEIFMKDCITPFNSDSYFAVDTTSPTSNKPDGFIQFNSTIDMNITALNGTIYWKPFSDERQGGYVEACVDTYLMFTDSVLGNEPETLDFVNNVLNISVSLDARFEVDDVDVEREDVGEIQKVNTDYSDLITAYVCDVSVPNQPTTASSTTPYNQGDELAICVTDKGDNIIQVEEFNFLTVSQSGSDTYTYIRNMLFNPEITTIVCLDGATVMDDRICYVKIRLLATFFSEQNPTDLLIEGSVYVVRNGSRDEGRNLRINLPSSHENNDDSLTTASSHRRVETREGSGGFGLKVSLEGTKDDSSVSSSNYQSISHLVSMTVGTAGAAALVF